MLKLSCCRFSSSWRKPWRLGWTSEIFFSGASSICWLGLENGGWLGAIHGTSFSHAGVYKRQRSMTSPRIVDFFVNNHTGLQLWFGIQKGGNENMQSIPPWEAVQRVKQNNSPLCTSKCKNSPFSCSLQTNKETALGAAGKARGHGSHPGTGRQQEQQLGTTTTTLSFYVLWSYAC